MIVTMFTDGAWNQQKRVGAWAAWMKMGDRATVRRSGMLLKFPMGQSGTAELAAIANGLAVLASIEDPPWPRSRVIVQTDSQEAIDALTRGSHTLECSAVVVRHVLESIAKTGWRLDLRHVKGHAGTATARNAVNTWCDAECRRLMVAWRAEKLVGLKAGRERVQAERAARNLKWFSDHGCPAPDNYEASVMDDLNFHNGDG